MALIEVIFEENGTEKVLSAIKSVDSSVSKLKSTLKSPLGLGNSQLIPSNFAAPAVQGVQAVMRQISALKQLAATPIQTKLFQNLAGPQLMQNLAPQVQAARQQMAQFNQQLGAGAQKSQDFGMQLGFLGRLIVAMGVRKVVHDIVDLTDAYASFQNKLAVVTPSTERLKIATEDLIKISLAAHQPLEETGMLFARMAQATQGLGVSQTKVTAFTSTLTKAITVSGATSNEAKNAIIQLSQGMALGAIKGQDLKSVLSFLPYVAQLIADKMGVAVGSLKEMGTQGKLTTQAVMNAIIDSAGEVDAKFGKMRLTVAQATEDLKTKYTVALGESGKMQDLMVGGLKLLTDNFDTALRAAVAFGTGLTAMWAGKGMVSLVTFLIANPWAIFVAGLAAATVALVTFGDKIHIPGDELLSLQDLATGSMSHMADSFKEQIALAAQVVESFSNIWEAAAGKSKGTDWTMEVAKAIDLLRIFTNPEHLILEPLANLGALPDTMNDEVIKEVNATQIALQNIRKNKVAQNDVDSTAKLNGDLARWRAGMQDANMRESTRTPKAKGHKEAGKTFSELMSEATFKAEVADDDDDITRKIETKLHTALEKLKPSIKKWGFDLNKEMAAASSEYNKKVNSNFEAYPDEDTQGKDDLSKLTEANDKALAQFQSKKKLLQQQSAEYEKQVGLLREQIALAALHEETRKKQLADEKAGEKLLDANLKKMLAAEEKGRKLRRENQQFLVNGVQSKQDFNLGIANELSPDMATNTKIQELREFATTYRNFPEWADKAIAKADELRDALALGGANLVFMEQFKSTWGPGGTLVTGFSDIASRVLTFNLSLRETKSLFRDLATSLEQQALSSLFQFGINAGMGALTNAISPSPTSLPGGVRGPDGKATHIDVVGTARPAPSLPGFPGFADGGYTGNYGTSQPAGIVHGQEFVVNSQATSKYRPMLEAMNNGNVGGSAPQAAKVTVHNYAGVQVETGVSHNEVQIIVSKAIRDQAPSVMAQHINNPNSQVSRSLSKSLTAERRRI